MTEPTPPHVPAPEPESTFAARADAGPEPAVTWPGAVAAEPEADAVPEPADPAPEAIELAPEPAVTEPEAGSVEEAGPEPVGVARTPTGNADVDAALDRLADADELATGSHLEVYEDAHRGLRGALEELDRRPGPPTPQGPPTPAAYGHGYGPGRP